jgi:hypothetical protein
VLTGQNRELNVELQRFVETDEQIRATLNRRNRVEELKTRSDCQVRQSYANLQSASPRRR